MGSSGLPLLLLVGSGPLVVVPAVGGPFSGILAGDSAMSFAMVISTQILAPKLSALGEDGWEYAGLFGVAQDDGGNGDDALAGVPESRGKLRRWAGGVVVVLVAALVFEKATGGVVKVGEVGEVAAEW